jgi:DNA-binding CsgD family transcriptional regulator
MILQGERAAILRQPKIQSPSMGLSVLLGKLWPGLRYISLGAWMAWLFLIFNGYWLSDIEESGAPISSAHFLMNSSSAIMLFLAAFLQERIGHLIDSKVAMFGTGLLGALGSAGIIVAGPYYFDAPIALFHLSLVVSGIASALLVLRLGRTYGKLSPGAVLFYALLSQLVAAILFFLVRANDFFSPIAGGPPLSGILALIMLPLLVSWMTGVQDSRKNAPPPTTAGQSQVPGLFWRLLTAIFVLSTIFAVVRGYCKQTAIPSEIILNADVIMVARAFFALMLLLVGIRFLKQIPLYKLYLFIMISATLLLAIAALLDSKNGHISTAIGFMTEVFNLIAWCMLAFFTYERSMPAIKVFGFGLFASLSGSVVGQAFGAYVLANLENAILIIVYITLAFLILIFTIVVFSEKNYERIFTSPDESQLDIRTTILQTAKADEDRNDGNRPWLEACLRLASKACCTSREQEVMVQLSMGRSPEIIAQRLNISLNTVRTHTRSIYAKLDVHSHHELVSAIDSERDSPS